MKFNIDSPPKNVRRDNKRRALREWHEKFAWVPTTVDETETSKSVVWFENYMRCGRHGPMRPGQRGNGLTFTKYSAKNYFKKKLDGGFDSEGGNIKGDGMTTADTSSGNVGGITQSTGRSLRSTKGKEYQTYREIHAIIEDQK